MASVTLSSWEEKRTPAPSLQLAERTHGSSELAKPAEKRPYRCIFGNSEALSTVFSSQGITMAELSSGSTLTAPRRGAHAG